jgi:hypothetical protein
MEWLQIPGMEPKSSSPGSSVVASLQIPGMDPGSSSSDVVEIPGMGAGSSSSNAALIPGMDPGISAASEEGPPLSYFCLGRSCCAVHVVFLIPWAGARELDPWSIAPEINKGRVNIYVIFECTLDWSASGPDVYSLIYND